MKSLKMVSVCLKHLNHTNSDLVMMKNVPVTGPSPSRLKIELHCLRNILCCIVKYPVLLLKSLSSSDSFCYESQLFLLLHSEFLYVVWWQLWQQSLGLCSRRVEVAAAASPPWALALDHSSVSSLTMTYTDSWGVDVKNPAEQCYFQPSQGCGTFRLQNLFCLVFTASPGKTYAISGLS